MMELTPAFEWLRKMFIVTGIIGAVEIVVLVVVFILMANEQRIRDWIKGHSRK